MNSKVIKEYRLTEEEASKLDTWHIVNTVIFRVADDAPSLSDSDAMDEFFDSVLSVQAAAFSAWFSTSFAVVGGMWHIFECCCATMVHKAIEGFELLYAPGPAATLRRACTCFPGGVVPRAHKEVEAFIFGDEDAVPPVEELGAEFEYNRVEKALDFERFFRDHRDCFVISKADVA